MIEKILLIAALLFSITTLAAGFFIAYQSGQLSKYKAKYAEAAQASIKAQTEMMKQNALIEAYKLDLAAAEENVRVETRVITEYAEREKEKVVERLIIAEQKTGGKELRVCEERLKIMEELIDDFYNN